MFTHGFKKNHNIRNLGHKLTPTKFLGIKSIPTTKTSSNIQAKHTSSPYDQYSNSNEVQYHPLGLKKHTSNKVNTLERR